MKKIIFLTVLFLVAGFVYARQDQGFLSGKIVSEKSGKAVSNTRIFADDSLEYTLSDSKGEYLLILTPGTHKVTISRAGYLSDSFEIEIVSREICEKNLMLKKDIFGHETIVITGTRTSRHIKDTPIKTELITSKEIEGKNAANLYEALEGNAGLRVEQQCSYCNFSMVRLQGLSGDHTQVLIDGEPIYTGLAGIYGLQQIPAALIERVEIVKGAGSAMYGSSAIGGTINIITKNPVGQKSKIGMELGTEGTNRFSINSTLKYNNWGLALFAQKDEAGEIDDSGDGWRQKPDGISDRTRNDNFSAGFNLKGNNVFFGKDSITISGQAINESRRGGVLETIENPFAEASEHIITNRYQMLLKYQKYFTDKNMFSLSFSGAVHSREATNDTFLGDYADTHGGDYPTIDLMQPYKAKEETLVANLNYYHIIGSQHHLLTGIQYNYDYLEESGKYVIIDPSSPDYGEDYLSTSDKKADELAFFLQDEFHISKRLELVFGGRYDMHISKDKFGGSADVANIEDVWLNYDESAFSPRMALSYKTTNLNIRASVGTGFRVPFGFSEDMHLCSGSPKINKPEGLKPEKSISYNLSIDYSYENLNLGMSFFRTDLRDTIGSTEASSESKALGYDYEWENIDRAYTQGVEFSTRFNPLRNFGVNASLAYTDARYSNSRSDWSSSEYADVSKYISRVPEFTSNIQFSYDNGDFSVFLNGNYTGRMYIDYYEEEDPESPGSKILHTPDFWVVNLKISKKIFKSLKGYMGAKNLFNYIQPEKHNDDAAFMYAPYYGKLIYCGVELNF